MCVGFEVQLLVRAHAPHFLISSSEEAEHMAPISDTHLRADELRKSLLKEPDEKRKSYEKENGGLKLERKKKTKKKTQKRNLRDLFSHSSTLGILATAIHLEWHLAG